MQWLGFQWAGEERYASNYFDQLHDWAIELIKAGKAYVCDLTPEQAREYRGSLTEPGKNSPFRDRSAEENLDLFARMKAGEFADGAKALRAKIDATGRTIDLEVDGGINAETAPLAIAAGADLLVAGTAAFSGGPEKYADNIARLKGA